MTQKKMMQYVFGRSLAKWTAFVSILVAVLQGCTTVGAGKETLVKHRLQIEDSRALELFPQYLLPPSQTSVGPILSSSSALATTSLSEYTKYMNKKYHGQSSPSADLSVTVRDRARAISFLPEEQQQNLVNWKLDNILADSKLPQDKKEELIQRIEADILHSPRLPDRYTVQHYADNKFVYYFQPRVELELSARIFSPTIEDRFSHIALVVDLHDYPKNTYDSTVRILDFAPKDSDMLEFTRGTLKQASELTAKAGFSASSSASKESQVSNVQESSPIAGLPGFLSKSTSGTGLTRGADLTFVTSEELTRELKDGLERRSTGILNDGKTFFADFRSIKNVRIGGTYTMDLMLEIPADAVTYVDNPDYFESDPVEEEVKADVYLVGVVRHVYKRGFTGTMHRAPEPENDDVYDVVVYKHIPDVELWKYNGAEILEPYPQDDKPSATIQVTTNREDASFTVRDTATGLILGSGRGAEPSVPEWLRQSPCKN